MLETLLTRGKDTDTVGLELASIPAGETLELRRGEEMLVAGLGGTADVAVDGDQLGRAGGRDSIFEGPGHAVYVPPHAPVSLSTSQAPATFVVTTAPLAGSPAAEARVVAPDAQTIAHRGQDNWARTVRTVLGPDDAAGRLLVGETINPPGSWSSYPPHKHDTHDPPAEAQLEEVYMFKLDPPGGFGVQIRYNGHGEECFTVRDGDVAAIPAGYHPVVAAPGYALCYLWVMAGEGRQLIPRLDPRHAWVQQEGA